METLEEVKKYLDDMIKFWRKSTAQCAFYYVDAFQSARYSIFDELLPKDSENGKTT